MTPMDILYERAYRFASKMHAGQIGKDGQPYIKHCIRVSMNCDTPIAKVAAILHDVLEDTDAQPEWIQARFGDEVYEAVICLTRCHKEAYMSYIERVALNPIAMEVKIADLIDNCNLTRLPTVTTNDAIRLKKYATALQCLLTKKRYM